MPLLDPALFDLDPDRLWLMHCAEGPVPKLAQAAVLGIMGKELRPWEMAWQADFLGIPAQLRRESARILGVEASDISLTQSTSSGLVLLAQAFPWEAGDEVLAPLGEFPSNAWPWKALASRGVGFREVALWEGHAAGREAWTSAPPFASDDPEARLLEALGPRTKVLALSWVRFQDGLKLDLGRLAAGCQARGVALVVDGSQGAGTAMPDLAGVSAFVTGGHKGLLGPSGQGFLWTDPAFRFQLAPLGSWLSVEDCGNFSRPSTDFERAWAEDGTRLEQGNYNLLGCCALLESLRMLNGVGISAMEAHIRALQSRLLEGLGGCSTWNAESVRLQELLGAGRLASILSLHHRGLGQVGLQSLLQEGFKRGVYASVREGYLRIAFHGWHGGADVERVLAWLKAV